ncbi:hypothetical protein HDU76_011370 [Blyttiomyces sp. JEL0837]|nr:hypothetical protein HDU76_011370 [Blyttiomyces sp. JEL0837]
MNMETLFTLQSEHDAMIANNGMNPQQYQQQQQFQYQNQNQQQQYIQQPPMYYPNGGQRGTPMYSSTVNNGSGSGGGGPAVNPVGMMRAYTTNHRMQPVHITPPAGDSTYSPRRVSTVGSREKLGAAMDTILQEIDTSLNSFNGGVNGNGNGGVDMKIKAAGFQGGNGSDVIMMDSGAGNLSGKGVANLGAAAGGGSTALGGGATITMTSMSEETSASHNLVPGAGDFNNQLSGDNSISSPPLGTSTARNFYANLHATAAPQQALAVVVGQHQLANGGRPRRPSDPSGTSPPYNYNYNYQSHHRPVATSNTGVVGVVDNNTGAIANAFLRFHNPHLNQHQQYQQQQQQQQMQMQQASPAAQAWIQQQQQQQQQSNPIPFPQPPPFQDQNQTQSIPGSPPTSPTLPLSLPKSSSTTSLSSLLPTVGQLTSIPGTYFGNIERLRPSIRAGEDPKWVRRFMVVGGPSINLFKVNHQPDDLPIDSLEMVGGKVVSAEAMAAGNTGEGMLLIKVNVAVTSLLRNGGTANGNGNGTGSVGKMGVGKGVICKQWLLRAASDDEADAWVAIIQAAIQEAEAEMQVETVQQQQQVNGMGKKTTGIQPIQTSFPNGVNNNQSRVGGGPPSPATPDQSSTNTNNQHPTLPVAIDGAHLIQRSLTPTTTNPAMSTGPNTPTTPTTMMSPNSHDSRKPSTDEWTDEQSALFAKLTVPRPPKLDEDVMSQTSEKSGTSSFSIKKMFNISTNTGGRRNGLGGGAGGNGGDGNPYVYLVRGGARQPGGRVAIGTATATGAGDLIVASGTGTGTGTGNRNSMDTIASGNSAGSGNGTYQGPTLATKRIGQATVKVVVLSRAPLRNSHGPDGDNGELSNAGVGGGVFGGHGASSGDSISDKSTKEPAEKKKAKVFMVRGGASFNSAPDVNKMIKVTNAVLGGAASGVSEEQPAKVAPSSASVKSAGVGAAGANGKPAPKVYMVRGGSRR